jgi:hypothetical protein
MHQALNVEGQRCRRIAAAPLIGRHQRDIQRATHTAIEQLTWRERLAQQRIDDQHGTGPAAGAAAMAWLIGVCLVGCGIWVALIGFALRGGL